MKTDFCNWLIILYKYMYAYMIYSDLVPLKRKTRKKGLNAIKASRAANSSMISRVWRVCRGTTRCTARNRWLIFDSYEVWKNEKKKKNVRRYFMHQPFLPLSVLCSDLMRNVKHCFIHIHRDLALKVDFDSWLAPPALEGRMQTTASTRTAADWSADKKITAPLPGNSNVLFGGRIYICIE